ncbi:hypothetical protein MSSIT_0484 [Methanosarcina siciliae T4/M]|uniref:Uncharacterized protein n=2 Tax=Methanosarcina siciliae TaxID=38027 RepID=A0A0E3P3X9_9EURY|nr:hypothetical protein MSSIT_0484 [Methanosarcina siciliae T4/M]
MQNHTVNVTSTTTYKYYNGQLEIKEVYTSKDPENKAKVNDFTKINKIPISAKDKITILNGESFTLEEGSEKVIVTEKTVVITSQTDPYPWWGYGYQYPQWTWSEDNGQYAREDPINLAWEYTNLNTVKEKMLDQGWISVSYPYEYDQYVSDPQYGWILDEGVADDKYGILGRYHTRLWQMSNGDVVANAHHDNDSPHQADQYEEAEDLVAGFFDNDLNNWWVLHDHYELDNYIANPLNDEYATCIYKVGS